MMPSMTSGELNTLTGMELVAPPLAHSSVHSPSMLYQSMLSSSVGGGAATSAGGVRGFVTASAHRMQAAGVPFVINNNNNNNNSNNHHHHYSHNTTMTTAAAAAAALHTYPYPGFPHASGPSSNASTMTAMTHGAMGALCSPGGGVVFAPVHNPMGGLHEHR
uniref:Uncharacterized protein n=1 Tax=Lygus hesperus TaxID=30085 RepID=A0A0A9Z4M6_LYGHE